MNVMEANRTRRSIRSYQNKLMEPEKLELILEAARLAPSADNRQEWRFIVVRNQDTREKLMKAALNQGFIAEAPVVIAACAETDFYVMPCGQLSYPIDVAIAIEHMILKAVEEGLGTCWIGGFNENKVKEILNIPDYIKVVELLALGYQKDIPPASPRKKLEEITMDEKWSD